MPRRAPGRVLSISSPLRPLHFVPYQGQVAATSTHNIVNGLVARHGTARRYGSRIDAQLVELAPPPSATVMADMHVLIASVPWRRASLNRLIRDVAAQAYLPVCVHLVLDGDGPPNAILDTSPLTSKGVKVDVREQHPGRGAGSRWNVVDDLKDTDVICNLDDDIGLGSNHYLAVHYEALRSAGAVAAGGYTPEGRFIMCAWIGIDYEGPINCLQAGAFSARVGCLRGLRSMPMAAEMLGVLGDDEGLIAAHLWRAGVPVRRVNTPVGWDPSGSDPRSQYRNMPGRITRLRNALRVATGWPWGNV